MASILGIGFHDRSASNFRFRNCRRDEETKRIPRRGFENITRTGKEEKTPLHISKLGARGSLGKFSVGGYKSALLFSASAVSPGDVREVNKKHGNGFIERAPEEILLHFRVALCKKRKESDAE